MSKQKAVIDKKNGKVYLILENGDMEEKASFQGTVATYEKSWVSDNYDNFRELTQKEYSDYIYKGKKPVKT